MFDQSCRKVEQVQCSFGLWYKALLAVGFALWSRVSVEPSPFAIIEVDPPSMQHNNQHVVDVYKLLRWYDLFRLRL